MEQWNSGKERNQRNLLHLPEMLNVYTMLFLALLLDLTPSESGVPHSTLAIALPPLFHLSNLAPTVLLQWEYSSNSNGGLESSSKCQWLPFALMTEAELFPGAHFLHLASLPLRWCHSSSHFLSSSHKFHSAPLKTYFFCTSVL